MLGTEFVIAPDHTALEERECAFDSLIRQFAAVADFFFVASSLVFVSWDQKDIRRIAVGHNRFRVGAEVRIEDRLQSNLLGVNNRLKMDAASALDNTQDLDLVLQPSLDARFGEFAANHCFVDFYNLAR